MYVVYISRIDGIPYQVQFPSEASQLGIPFAVRVTYLLTNTIVAM
jgi:hypothetical protein